MEQRNFFSATRIAMISLFGALAGILYCFGFSIPMAFPGFLELNFSDVPALIGSFALGPLSGCIIVLVKVFIKLIIKGTGTVFVGELADLIIGIAFVLPAGLVYKYKRTLKGAFLSVGVGTASSVLTAVLFNWLILVPFYVKLFFGGNWDGIIGMMKPLFPACTKENFYNLYLWVSVLPFNLMRCLIAAAITMLVYKLISRAINKINERFVSRHGEGSKKGTLITVFVSVGVLLLLVGGVLLRYFLSR